MEEALGQESLVKPPQPMTWEKQIIHGDPPSSRSSHTATVFDDQVVIIGGFGNGIERTDMFHIETKTMESANISPMDKSVKNIRVAHSATAVGDAIYVFGGWDGSKYLNHGFLYDPLKLTITSELSKGRNLPPGRRDHTLTLVQGRLVLFGGWNCLEMFNDLWVLSDGWVWSQIATEGTIPSARRGHTSTAWRKYLIVFGGLHGFTEYLNDLYMLNTKSVTWEKVDTTGPAPSPRAWHTANLIGNSLVVFGGTSGCVRFYNSVHVLNLDTLVWVEHVIVGDTPAPRCSHTAVLVPESNDLLVFGGISPASEEEKSILALSDSFLLKTGIPVAPDAAVAE